jgi:hypothetical protein
MDTEVSGLPGMIMSDLFGGARDPEPVPPVRPVIRSLAMPSPAPVPAEPAAHSQYIIEVSNGSVHTQATFSRPGGKP